MEETDCLAQLKAHEALQYDELKTVIRKFNSLNIPVMLIKGAVDLAVPDNRPPGSLPLDMGDLHYNMNKDQRVEGLFIIEEMWQQSKSVEFEGVSSFIPSISDQFWIRLVHIFLLHLIIKAYYLKFLRMKKRNSFIKTGRNV